MAGSNPIQIVLNDRDFFTEPERGRMGRPADFFAGRDEAFRQHKRALSAQLTDAVAELSLHPGKVGIVRVTLREEALAKSHRPERGLFMPEEQPCIGGAGLGELFYLSTANHLANVWRKVQAAEEETIWVAKRDGPGREPNPSRERADTGAISKIDLPPPEDKRDFSAEAAVQWLSNPNTGGVYLVELFEASPPMADRIAPLQQDFNTLLATSGIEPEVKVLGNGAIALRLAEEDVGGQLSASVPTVTMDVALHQAALEKLANHPLVRRISLPVLAEPSDSYANGHLGVAAAIAARAPGETYPKVGVIDTGVAAPLAPWVVGVHDFIDQADLEPTHGTFIGGLLTSAALLNPSLTGLERDGCDVIDIPLFPKKPKFASFYPNGFTDFLAEMDSAIGEAVANHGVRVFNLSINAVQPVQSGAYSYYAQRLDEIAARYDVVIVNSAGNLPYKDRRKPWPGKVREALRYFAGRAEPDTIHQPCESHRTLAVGAINPPGSKVHLQGAPTTYTRRGPGLRVGCKPDVAHYGGGEGEGVPAGCGLESLAVDGTLSSSCGTSYAAPLVAKTLATLQHRIASPLPAHSLRALMIHSCRAPDLLLKQGMADLRRQFVGFGIPATVDDMLFDDEHAITLVFSSVLPRDGQKARSKVMRFPFQWPASLVDRQSGACRGAISATLVATPPVDRKFGAEFVRINVEAAVQQRQPIDRKDGEPSYRDVLHKAFLPKVSGAAVPERELIKQGLKWWPTKAYQRTLPAAGLGERSEWRIEVSSLRRSQVDFPAEGVPFCLVVTISDPDGQAGVFQEMRRALGAQLVQLGDLQATQRVRPVRT